MILKITIIYKNFDKKYLFYDVKNVEEIRHFKNRFKIYSRNVPSFEMDNFEMKDVLDIKLEHL